MMSQRTTNGRMLSGKVTSPVSVKNRCTKIDYLKTEMLWTLPTVVCHNSCKSNDQIDRLFKVMFPDSYLASKFSCGDRKTAYLTVFGLAVHFKQELRKEITGPFTVAFDESLNKKSQKRQIDIHVRF